MTRILLLALIGIFLVFWIGSRVQNLLGSLRPSNHAKPDPLRSAKKADVIDVR